MPHRTAPEASGPGVATDVQVSRWQAGDDTAFELLYARFAPLLAARVRGRRTWPLLAPRFQVEDVVQEIWSRVVPAAKRNFTPSGKGSFLAFLATLADRAMVDLARRGTARKRGEGASLVRLDTNCERVAGGSVLGSHEETPTSSARRSELEEIAQGILTEREFGAWDLVELQGYTGPEAGLALDTSDSAVRGLLLRARTKLVERLGER